MDAQKMEVWVSYNILSRKFIGNVSRMGTDFTIDVDDMFSNEWNVFKGLFIKF